MYNGILYFLADKIIALLNLFNLFELFKTIGRYFGRNKVEPKEKVKLIRIWVDVYIFLKWSAILLLYVESLPLELTSIIVWYLIFSNIFTFFNYFIWQAQNAKHDHHRQKRRFVNLVQAVFFSHFAFANLFYTTYSKDFSWASGKSYLGSLWYSISNSVSGNYDLVKPLTTLGYSVSMIQFLITFLFVSIIITRAVPEIIND